MMIINTINCKSILNKSGIPAIDYSINPYVGCSHKCQYCYAVFMKKFTKHTEPWGDFVDVKINAPEVLKNQLRRLRRKSRISFGTVCDAYQPLEAKYKITRRCLETLIYYQHKISILTKSTLVLRDIDLLKKLKNIKVSFTVTTLNTNIKRVFEPNTVSPQKRFEAIEVLTRYGIPTQVFVAPVLPYLSDSKEALSQIFEASQRAGAKSIMFDTLNPYPKVWLNVTRLIAKHFPEAINIYDYYYNNKTSYATHLREKIRSTSRHFRIKCKFAF